MKKVFFLILVAFASQFAKAQTIPSYSAKQLMEHVQAADTVYIINFWATWCGPCVKELPVFNELQQYFSGKPVKVLMVSLDFKDAYPKKIEAFIKKKKLAPEVVWLNETDANKFIPAIEEQWQGSIPATLILYGKNQYRNFYEGVVTASQISMLVEKQLAY